MTVPRDAEPPVEGTSFAAHFTSEPSAARARQFHASYRGLMRQHFLQAVSSAAEGLQLDLAPLSHRIAALAPEDRLSPAAYTALTQLSEALSSGDVTRVTDQLQALSILPEQELRDDTFRIEPVLTEPWETPFIESVRNDPLDGFEEKVRLIRPLVGRDSRAEVAACAEALELLAEVDPELHAEFLEYVNRVKLFSGRGFLGFSSPAAFGAIFIRLPETERVPHFLEHLVHELSHLGLNVMMAHDPLLRNAAAEGPAPLRADARPLYQVLHATYVLNRNVRVTRRVVARHPELGYEATLRDFEEKYAQGLLAVRERAEFTELGEQLFATLEPPAA